ncbi:partitioning protein [Pseudomonas sp. 2FE]|uniref:partitioning protein n=1 Tax=Pseudomonas sp. 2FE TaxID=2502190 RepID=UPI0010F53183|nr:partitioning protein [Pseudomonas sp. 2FE]
MTTAALASVAPYLLSMAVTTTIEPSSFDLGVTTLEQIERDWTIIDKIGTSYTGGPVLNLSEWEINIDGITDLQLAFNADGLLDVATVKARKGHLHEVVDLFKGKLTLNSEEEISDDYLNVTFISGEHEIIIESLPLDEKFTVNFISQEFKQARNDARKLYA